MANRGQIVLNAIQKSSISKTKLAKSLKVARSTLYLKLDNPNLDWDTITEIGRIINHDFSIEFPELRKKTYIINEVLSSANEEDPEPMDLPDCKRKLELLKTKYIALFEKYAELLEKKAS